LLADGLRRYGFDDLADALRRDSLELMTRSGFREYYDPRDGDGCGSTDFSWSAALAIELLSQERPRHNAPSPGDDPAPHSRRHSSSANRKR